MTSHEHLNFNAEAMMLRAVELALKAQFETEPNPLVGAVLVDQSGHIISEGYHHKAGSPHAEVEALKDFEEVPDNCILFVTLEPCNFHGKTPPCTELILQKKVKTVVVGCKDPNPRVSGNGISFLRDHGVQVIWGICEETCKKINRVFNKHIVTKMPYITVKTAMSLDGKISMASGESQWITGQQAREQGHRLRSQHQAIAVGRQTLFSDNPRLTDRISSKPKQPVRVVFSSKGLIPADSQFTSDRSTKRILITGNEIEKSEVTQLKSLGIQVLATESRQPEIRSALKLLYQEGICSMLVEGGAELISSFLRENLIDQYYLFVSGKVIGDQMAPSWSGNTGIEKLANVPVIKFDHFESIGEDLLIVGYPG